YPLLPGIRGDVKTLIATKAAVACVSAASFKPSALATESIVAAFGAEMASSTLVASSGLLPTSLGGTSVIVRDSANDEKLAQLFFVSPEQVNFLMPAGLVDGEATVVVTNSEGRISTDSVTLAPVAPALFAANATGRDVAAAVVLRIKASGARIYEPVAEF